MSGGGARGKNLEHLENVVYFSIQVNIFTTSQYKAILLSFRKSLHTHTHTHTTRHLQSSYTVVQQLLFHDAALTVLVK